MKNKPIIIIKNIFCVITIIWSAIMLTEYLVVLLPFQLKGILFEIADFLVIFLYLGIVAVPILFIISAIFIGVAGGKYDYADKFRKLNVATVVLPIVTFTLMLITNFNARLQ